MTQTDAALLRQAHDLIKDKGAHLQHEFARDDWGYVVLPMDARAVKFCAIGALMHVTHRKGEADAHKLARLSARGLVTRYFNMTIKELAAVNDLEGHEAVLDRFARAIMRADQEAATA